MLNSSLCSLSLCSDFFISLIFSPFLSMFKKIFYVQILLKCAVSNPDPKNKKRLFQAHSNKLPNIYEVSHFFSKSLHVFTFFVSFFLMYSHFLLQHFFHFIFLFSLYFNNFSKNIFSISQILIINTPLQYVFSLIPAILCILETYLIIACLVIFILFHLVSNMLQ